jgi:hypothetical protein
MARKKDPHTKEQALSKKLEASKAREEQLLRDLTDTRLPPFRAARLAVQRAQVEMCKLQDNSPDGVKYYESIMSNLHRVLQTMLAVGLEDFGPRIFSEGELAPDVTEALKEQPVRMKAVRGRDLEPMKPSFEDDDIDDDLPAVAPAIPPEALSLKRHEDDDGDNEELPS